MLMFKMRESAIYLQMIILLFLEPRKKNWRVYTAQEIILLTVEMLKQEDLALITQFLT